MPIVTLTYGKIINQCNTPSIIYSTVEFSYHETKPLKYIIQSFRNSKANEYHLFTGAVWIDEETLNKYINSAAHKALQASLKSNIFVNRKVEKIKNVTLDSNEVKYLEDTLYEKLPVQAKFTNLYYNENRHHDPFISKDYQHNHDFTDINILGTIPANIAYY